MPELPDVTVYVEALERFVAGRTLEAIRLKSPFLLRSVEPPLAAAVGREVAGARRLASGSSSSSRRGTVRSPSSSSSTS